jgi:hypothetical protein
MGFLTGKQKQTVADLFLSAGRYAKALNEQLHAAAADGGVDKKLIQEARERTAAINAQTKAGAGLVAAHMAFTERLGGLMKRVEAATDTKLLDGHADRPAE